MRSLFMNLCAAVCFLTIIGALESATIGFGDNSPNSPVVGKIQGAGTYSLGDKQDFIKIDLLAYTPGGGPSGSAKCNVDQVSKTWDGTIDSLTSMHTYTVYANLVYMEGFAMKGQNSAEVKVTVK